MYNSSVTSLTGTIVQECIKTQDYTLNAEPRPSIVGAGLAPALDHAVTLPPVPNRPYILVIDDEEAIVSVIMFLLETEGYAGIGISDSQQVLPFLQQAGPQHMPAVILLDLMMPGISGYTIAAELARNEQFAHIPVIIMTADSRVHSASAVPGAIDYLAKPFQISALLSKLEHYL